MGIYAITSMEINQHIYLQFRDKNYIQMLIKIEDKDEIIKKNNK